MPKIKLFVQSVSLATRFCAIVEHASPAVEILQKSSRVSHDWEGASEAKYLGEECYATRSLRTSQLESFCTSVPVDQHQRLRNRQ